MVRIILGSFLLPVFYQNKIDFWHLRLTVHARIPRRNHAATHGSSSRGSSKTTSHDSGAWFRQSLTGLLLTSFAVARDGFRTWGGPGDDGILDGTELAAHGADASAVAVASAADDGADDHPAERRGNPANNVNFDTWNELVWDRPS